MRADFFVHPDYVSRRLKAKTPNRVKEFEGNLIWLARNTDHKILVYHHGDEGG